MTINKNNALEDDKVYILRVFPRKSMRVSLYIRNEHYHTCIRNGGIITFKDKKITPKEL